MEILNKNTQSLNYAYSFGSSAVNVMEAASVGVLSNITNQAPSAGTFLSITTDGTGTHTITPTALAGASVKIQACNDDEVSNSSVWSDIPIEVTGDATKSYSITGTSVAYLKERFPAMNFIRAYYTLTAGQLLVDQTIIVKG